MSHFSVMVVVPQKLIESHDNNINSAVEELMAPYQENNMGTCPEMFMEFSDEESDYLNEYNTGMSEVVRVPKDKFITSGEKDEGSTIQDPDNANCLLVNSYHDMFYIKETDYGRKHAIPEDLETLHIPNNQFYGSFEDFMLHYHGAEGRDPKKGRYGYWENPNAKWDYWRIGGRWRGFLIVKEGVTPSLSGADWDSPKKVSSPQSADVAQIKDIDWDAFNIRTDTKLTTYWNKMLVLKNAHDRILNKTGQHPLREELQEEICPNDGMELTNIEMDILWTLLDLGLAEWEEDKTLSKKHNERICRLRISNLNEEVLRAQVRSAFEFSTYAVCTSKGWYESASMGWFGLDDGTPDAKEKWRKSFYDMFIANLPQDTWIAICDCHT